jgi:hypothetical protein
LPATSGTFLTTTGGVAPGTTGNVLTSNGTTWTSAALPAGGVTSLNGQSGAITNTDYGAIGSYIIAAQDTFGTIERLPNVTVAGSTLIRTTQTAQQGININSGAVVNSVAYVSLGFSGTWRRMTRSISGTATNSGGDLYVRIS